VTTTATSGAVQPLDDTRRDELVNTLVTDGIIGLKGAFAPEWADVLGEDVMAAFEEAKVREGGAIGRGPQRWYVEIHPEQIRGFADLAGHPWIVQVATEVLGADYEIVEVGFDIPFAGAMDQPWHRDFPMGDYTRRLHKLNSLAVNVTCVDTTDDMGPFEIAPGTQWDDSEEFDHGMFPPRSHYPRYVERAVRKYPQRGDISIRSALTIHRGTKNRSQLARPVLVLGLDGPEANNAAHHDMAVTQAYYDALPQVVREHLHCPIVETLTPIVQKHTIEGLVMGDDGGMGGMAGSAE
jgi:hypothetical protein